MVGLALLSGLRRGELFALRWKDIDTTGKRLTVREAVYDGKFGTPKTEAGQRTIPLSETALMVIEEWKRRVKKPEPEGLVFSTRGGTPISPNNVLRRAIFPACDALKLKRATWLTFRRTYSSWCHDQGVPGKVVAQLMGHANVDTTLNVYTQVLDGSLRGGRRHRRIQIVHDCSQPGEPGCANSLKRLARPAGLEPATSWFVARRSIQLS